MPPARSSSGCSGRRGDPFNEHKKRKSYRVDEGQLLAATTYKGAQILLVDQLSGAIQARKPHEPVNLAGRSTSADAQVCTP